MGEAQRFVCPTCRKVVVIRAFAPGKVLRCPKCGELFSLPTTLSAGEVSPVPTAAAGSDPDVESLQPEVGLESPGTASLGTHVRLYLAIAFEEVKDVARATAAQVMRLVRFGREWLKGRQLDQEASASLTALGTHLVARGIGDASLRDRVAQLDSRIATMKAANTGTRPLEAERHATLKQIAERFISQAAPADLAAEHGQAAALVNTAADHQQTLSRDRLALAPASRREWLQVAIGSGTSLLLLIGLGRAMRSRPRTAVPGSPLPGPGEYSESGQVGGDGGAGGGESQQFQPVPSQGTQVCSACFGSGQQDCTFCSGSGKAFCYDCNGTGQRRSGAAMIACFTCNGSGRKRCTNFACNFGKVQCPQCNGLGRR